MVKSETVLTEVVSIDQGGELSKVDEAVELKWEERLVEGQRTNDEEWMPRRRHLGTCD